MSRSSSGRVWVSNQITWQRRAAVSVYQSELHTSSPSSVPEELNSDIWNSEDVWVALFSQFKQNWVSFISEFSLKLLCGMWGMGYQWQNMFLFSNVKSQTQFKKVRSYQICFRPNKRCLAWISLQTHTTLPLFAFLRAETRLSLRIKSHIRMDSVSGTLLHFFPPLVPFKQGAQMKLLEFFVLVWLFTWTGLVSPECVCPQTWFKFGYKRI